MIATAATLAAVWLVSSAMFGQQVPPAPTPTDPWTWVVGGGGALGALMLFLYGFKSEWWVTGRVYRRRIEELKELRAEQREDRRAHAAEIAAERQAIAAERERVSLLLERSTGTVADSTATQRQVIELLNRLDPPTLPPRPEWKRQGDG